MDENAPHDAAEAPKSASSADAAGAHVARTAARLGEYGFFFDFDGTLSPIQQDPESVQPVPGGVAALAALAANARVTAIVSARPVAFLAGRFGGVPGLRLNGLYGLEYSPDGGATVTTVPEAEPYAPVIARVVAEAREAFPGALIEDKRLSCALHFRTDPALEPGIESWAALHAEAYGLRLQHGRMVVELKPPLDTDKGAVVLREAAGLAGAWYFGDDLGDLPAFAALDKLAAEQPGFHAVRVAVGTAEGRGAALAEHADVLLDGPESVPTLLDSFHCG
ncbi:MAG TPA: trehalose-phosphatase [Actinocrinis sp.]|uniref:trehalose-phosphatase n=1 Tax=Actinocrinis sp. TaxID=1920516 RepID=UPI002D26E291|nr:trehalose-phosphatase [Actinocrinis sp.]HZU56912.1 trehalose-phosphatase [Actinocrinis sp.]